MTAGAPPTGGSGRDGEEARQNDQHDQLARVRRRRAKDLADGERYAPQPPLGGARRHRPGVAVGLAGGVCVLAAAGAAAVLVVGPRDPGVPPAAVEPAVSGGASTEPSATSDVPSSTPEPPVTAPQAPAPPPPPPAAAGPGVGGAGPAGPPAGPGGRPR